MRGPAHAYVQFLAVVIVAILSACGTNQAIYVYRDGATVAEADKVAFDCRVAAARNVPSDTQVYSTPGWTTPVYTDCASNRGRTSCVTSGGITMGGDVHSYDANAGLRAEYFRRCVAAAGFSLTTLPSCPKNAVPAGLRQQLSGQLRPPQPDACVVPVTAEGANLARPDELIQNR